MNFRSLRCGGGGGLPHPLGWLRQRAHGRIRSASSSGGPSSSIGRGSYLQRVKVWCFALLFGQVVCFGWLLTRPAAAAAAAAGLSDMCHILSVASRIAGLAGSSQGSPHIRLAVSHRGPFSSIQPWAHQQGERVFSSLRGL